MKTKYLVLSGLLMGLSAMAGSKYKLISASDLDKMVKADPAKTYIFDANNEQVRSQYGVVHGATLLTSSKDYDAAAVLPKDKASTVVFYCANTECSASHVAADKAISKGYTNVDVMSDGIMGWTKAKLPTDKKAKI